MRSCPAQAQSGADLGMRAESKGGPRRGSTWREKEVLLGWEQADRLWLVVADLEIARQSIRVHPGPGHASFRGRTLEPQLLRTHPPLGPVLGESAVDSQWDLVAERPCRLHGSLWTVLPPGFCHLGASSSTRCCLPGPGTVSRATLCSAQQWGLTQAVQVAWPCQSGLSTPCRALSIRPGVLPPIFLCHLLSAQSPRGQRHQVATPI